VNDVSRRRIMLAAGALLSVPLRSIAQPQSKVARIGFLTNGTVTSTRGQLEAFVRGLQEQGYFVGRNVIIESSFAEGKLDRLPALVAELLARKIDVIYAPSGIAAQAARQSGTTVPIVFAFAPDPIGQGFGTSFSRPGGSMTGLTSTHTELSGKRIELLKETFPAIRRIAVLHYLAPSGAGVAEQLAETERAANVLGVALVREESSRVEDFERAFANIHKQRLDALIVIENPVFFTNRVRLTQLAASLRIPAIYNVSEYVHAGGLMSYGASYADLSRRAAAYVVKIVNGRLPGDLPIERPTKFEFAINVGTARTMGLQIPPSVLLRADETVGG
jgi:putative tryptophan/tyrosine transport system substrate-binding protein